MADIERREVTLAIDQDLPAKLKALELEGWSVDPTRKSHATYCIVRIPPPKQAGGIGELVIDESKMTIIRADGSIA